MIKITVQNLGPIKETDITLSKFNLISGKNSTGKSFFVRLLYASLATLLEKENGQENDKEKNIERTLAKRIRWVFQQRDLGAIVNRITKEDLCVQISINNKNIIDFSVSRSAKRKIALKEIYNFEEIPYENCLFLFLPTLLDIELALANYREYYKNNLGVSDIFWDALQSIRTVGVADEVELKSISKKIEKIIGGKFVYKARQGVVFKEKDKEYDVKITASGIKIFGFLQLLIERNLLRENSLLIIEEPECNLHPAYIFKFIDVLKELIKQNVYVIIVTHSSEIIRYAEYLLRTKKILSSDVCFALFKKEDRLAVVKTANDLSLLTEMLEELTEEYFNLVFKEAKEIEH